jgi:hypothetical protein
MKGVVPSLGLRSLIYMPLNLNEEIGFCKSIVTRNSYTERSCGAKQLSRQTAIQWTEHIAQATPSALIEVQRNACLKLLSRPERNNLRTAMTRIIAALKSIGLAIGLFAFIVGISALSPVILLIFYHYLAYNVAKKHGFQTGLIIFGLACLPVDAGLVIWGIMWLQGNASF